MAGLSNIFGGGDYAEAADLTADEIEEGGMDLENARELSDEEGDPASSDSAQTNSVDTEADSLLSAAGDPGSAGDHSSE